MYNLLSEIFVFYARRYETHPHFMKALNHSQTEWYNNDISV